MSDYVTEAEAIDDAAAFAEEKVDETRKLLAHEIIAERENALEGLQRAKAEAQRAEVGATIHCAQCGTPMKKRHPKAAFCTNHRHGPNNCKDRWRNRVEGLRAYLESRD